MGHLRMGRLPKTRRWTQVVDLLDAGSLDTGELAAAVFEAADYRLRQLANDQGLGYSFWLLTRIALAARGNTFVEDLSRLGITTDPGLSSLQFIAQVTDRAREQISVSPSEGDFAELGSLALPYRPYRDCRPTGSQFIRKLCRGPSGGISRLFHSSSIRQIGSPVLRGFLRPGAPFIRGPGAVQSRGEPFSAGQPE